MILQMVSKQKAMMKALFAFLIIGSFIYVTGSFFVPVGLGAVIGIVALPLVLKLTNRGWGKRIASFVVTIGITLSILIPTTSLLVVGGQAAFEQLNALKVSETGSIENLAYSPGFKKMVTSVSNALGLPAGGLLQSARKAFLDVAEFISTLFGEIIYQLPAIAIGLLAIILAIYYTLNDGHRVVSFCRANSPFDSGSTERIFQAIRDASYSVIVATFFSALSQTLVMTLGVWFTGTPNTALIGLFTFLFAFLPIVGTAPISLGVVAYHFAMGHSTEGLVMLGVGLVVSVVDNVVHLVVLKHRSHIHPLIGFVAVFGGLKVLGFGGIFIGPVLAAITMELIPVLIRDHKQSAPSTTIEVAPQEVQLQHRPS
jgi:predicted PurR-regulated permease PerM